MKYKDLKSIIRELTSHIVESQGEVEELPDEMFEVSHPLIEGISAIKPGLGQAIKSYKNKLYNHCEECIIRDVPIFKK